MSLGIHSEVEMSEGVNLKSIHQLMLDQWGLVLDVAERCPGRSPLGSLGYLG
jgi:hypothetical protein